MPVRLKLLVAFAAAALVISLAGAASPERPATNASGQTPPAELPSPDHAGRDLSADAGARAGAEAERQFQGMRRLPGNGGGAEGLVHDGHAHYRSRPLQGRRPAASRHLRAAVRGRALHDLVRRVGRLPRRRRLRRQQGRRQGFGRGRMPAQGINFDAAKSYLAWLSRKVGRTYRLPSESEREYFTRAGTTTPFWFGKTISPQDANYAASTPMPTARAASTARARRWWIPTRRTRSDSIRCTATSGNGPRTASTSATPKTRRPTARRGWKATAQAHGARRHLELVRGQVALGLSRRRPRRRRRQQLSRGPDAERAGAVRHYCRPRERRDDGNNLRDPDHRLRAWRHAE